MTFIDTVSLLLLAAVGLSLLADKVGDPLSVGAGRWPGIGPCAGYPAGSAQPGTVLSIFLPPILFEAAYNAHWRELHRDRLLIAETAILPEAELDRLRVGLRPAFVGASRSVGPACADRNAKRPVGASSPKNHRERT